jgi:hypothetical protein
MKHIAIATLAALIFSVSTQANDTTDLMQLVRQLQQQVQQQQAQIDLLKGDVASQARIAEMVDVAVEERIDTEGFGALKEVGSVVALDDADSLSISGDILLRYENAQLPQGGSADYDSGFETRVRLGLGWQKGDWEAAIGVVGGSYDGRVSESVWNGSTEFESNNLNLDYAYATHHWDGYSLTLGQHVNPYHTSNIFWDSDLRFTGATATADLEAAFVTTGIYDVQNNGAGADDTWLWAIQAGTQFETEGAEGLLAIAYYHFNNLSQTAGGVDINTVGSFSDEFNSEYDLQILDVFARAEADMGEATVGVFAQYAHNFGADGTDGQSSLDPDDNDNAWAIGGEVKAGNFTIGYSYADIEADALHSGLTDYDFTEFAANGGTNREGHIVGVGYEVNSNMSLGAKGFFTEAAEDEGSGDEDGELYQFDILYKF